MAQKYSVWHLIRSLLSSLCICLMMYLVWLTSFANGVSLYFYCIFEAAMQVVILCLTHHDTILYSNGFIKKKFILIELVSFASEGLFLAIPNFPFISLPICFMAISVCILLCDNNNKWSEKSPDIVSSKNKLIGEGVFVNIVVFIFPILLSGIVSDHIRIWSVVSVYVLLLLDTIFIFHIFWQTKILIKSSQYAIISVLYIVIQLVLAITLNDSIEYICLRFLLLIVQFAVFDRVRRLMNH